LHVKINLISGERSDTVSSAATLQRHRPAQKLVKSQLRSNHRNLSEQTLGKI